jgi:hypothetical protein
MRSGLVSRAQHEHAIRLASDILAGLSLEIAVQTLHAAGEVTPIVLLVE